MFITKVLKHVKTKQSKDIFYFLEFGIALLTYKIQCSDLMDCKKSFENTFIHNQNNPITTSLSANIYQ